MGFFKKVNDFIEKKGKEYKEYQDKKIERDKIKLAKEIDLEKRKLELDKIKKQRDNVRPKSSGFLDPTPSSSFGFALNTDSDKKSKKKGKKYTYY